MVHPSLPSSLHPLDSVAGLLDLSMLYHLWISGTFLLLTWYLTVQLFRVFVTEVRSSDQFSAKGPKACHQPMADRFDFVLNKSGLPI